MGVYQSSQLYLKIGKYPINIDIGVDLHPCTLSICSASWKGPFPFLFKGHFGSAQKPIILSHIDGLSDDNLWMIKHVLMAVISAKSFMGFDGINHISTSDSQNINLFAMSVSLEQNTLSNRDLFDNILKKWNISPNYMRIPLDELRSRLCDPNTPFHSILNFFLFFSHHPIDNRIVVPPTNISVTAQSEYLSCAVPNSQSLINLPQLDSRIATSGLVKGEPKLNIAVSHQNIYREESDSHQIKDSIIAFTPTNPLFNQNNTTSHTMPLTLKEPSSVFFSKNDCLPPPPCTKYTELDLNDDDSDSSAYSLPPPETKFNTDYKDAIKSSSNRVIAPSGSANHFAMTPLTRTTTANDSVIRLTACSPNTSVSFNKSFDNNHTKRSSINIDFPKNECFQFANSFNEDAQYNDMSLSHQHNSSLNHTISLRRGVSSLRATLMKIASNQPQSSTSASTFIDPILNTTTSKETKTSNASASLYSPIFLPSIKSATGHSIRYTTSPEFTKSEVDAETIHNNQSMILGNFTSPFRLERINDQSNSQKNHSVLPTNAIGMNIRNLSFFTLNSNVPYVKDYSVPGIFLPSHLPILIKKKNLFCKTSKYIIKIENTNLTKLNYKKSLTLLSECTKSEIVESEDNDYSFTSPSTPPQPDNDSPPVSKQTPFIFSSSPVFSSSTNSSKKKKINSISNSVTSVESVDIFDVTPLYRPSISFSKPNKHFNPESNNKAEISNSSGYLSVQSSSSASVPSECSSTEIDPTQKDLLWSCTELDVESSASENDTAFCSKQIKKTRTSLNSSNNMILSEDQIESPSSCHQVLMGRATLLPTTDKTDTNDIDKFDNFKTDKFLLSPLCTNYKDDEHTIDSHRVNFNSSATSSTSFDACGKFSPHLLAESGEGGDSWVLIDALPRIFVEMALELRDGVSLHDGTWDGRKVIVVKGGEDAEDNLNCPCQLENDKQKYLFKKQSSFISRFVSCKNEEDMHNR